MAFLEDPTIQRILEDVNKAASGGVLGLAGNYISEPTETMQQFQSDLSSSENNFYNQDQAPLFYPTPEMFGMDGLTNFEDNMNFDSIPSIVPMPTSSGFDLYSTGLYNTIPQSFLSPYENYNDMTKLNTKQLNNNNQMRSISSVSSANNDLLFEHHRHQEYSTIPPIISSAVPNLGLNVRATPPQLDSIPLNLADSNQVQLTSEQISDQTTNITTPTMNLIGDKEDNNLLPPIDNDDTDQHHHLTSNDKIFYDPNPQVIQRKGSHSVTYKQNIIVRFFQPPPIPNAGPLIIKEVRPPQPPSLPPLVIKQRPTPPKTPPPLIIREKPPPLPSTLATKVITRQLPPEPAPPRAVIIERLPPLPPKPRDIIIERWLPYEIVNQKRKVIVQRAQKTSKEHPQPKNVIITYEPVHAKIVRNFCKQTITREDPQAYSTRYGSQLYDSNIVIQKARAIGVTEDLNPPVSGISTMTTNVATGPDYDLPPPPTTMTMAADGHQQEKYNVENKEKVEGNYNQEQHEEIIQTSSTSPAHTDENIQEEDVLVEENVTPFYMNSGENLQQTLHRLGIDLPESVINEHNF